MLKNNKGITIIALMITLSVMITLAGVSVTMGFSTMQDVRRGRLISNMKLVQAKVELIEENYTFYNDDTFLVGEGPYQIDSSNQIDEISISEEEMETIAEEAKTSVVEVRSWKWYKWNKEQLKTQNLAEDMLLDEEFFYVDYEHGEILYSVGTQENGVKYYSMTGLENL